ncbi:LPXTG cell wall anchor domain-containing protein, partial [Microvirga sp. 3-52]|nr:LPXTG cell wall anchor domain-containing protein [Microvirga sp. 3-52]
IYIFNEQSKQWGNVAGWGNAKNGVITIEVDHFSTYGAFMDVEGPTNVQITEKEVTVESISFNLSANDPSGIKEYRVSRDGEEIAVLIGAEKEFSDIQLKTNQSYEYTIIAVDNVGNESEEVKLAVSTLPEGGKTEPENEADKKETQVVKKEKTEDKSPTVNEKTAQSGKDKLPKTATNTFTYLLVGLALVSVGGITLFIRRKAV